MKTRMFATWLMLGVAVMMTGCMTTARRQAYLDEFSSRNVDATVYAKVEARRTLDVGDISHLTSKGVPEDLITKHIRWKATVYNLKTTDIDQLREAKASEELINFLLNTSSLYGHAFPAYYWGRSYYCPPIYYYGYHYHPGGLRYYPR